MVKLIYADLTYSVRSAIYEVYNELRHLDISEAGWAKALIIALQERAIPAQDQVEYELRYKDYRIGRFFVDILAYDKLVIELKAAEKLYPIDQAQVLTYLKITGLKLGLLINFGGNELAIKRIPNFISDRSASSAPSNLDQPPDQWLYPVLTGELRAVLYEVHNELGPGLIHMHYRRATQVELRLRGIPYEVKKEITIQFHQQPIETYETRLLTIDDKVLIAPVAVREITPQLRGRFRQYLKLLGFKIGLVANFHALNLEIETVRI